MKMAFALLLRRVTVQAPPPGLPELPELPAGFAFVVDAGAYVTDAGNFVIDAVELEPFVEQWEGADGSPWDSARWPETFAEAAGSVTIENNMGEMRPAGDAENPTYVIARARADTGARTDFDLTTTFQFMSTGEQYHAINVRASNDWSVNNPEDPQNGYQVMAYTWTTFDQVFVRSIVDSIRGSPIQPVDKDWGTNPWNMRIRCEGNELKVRVWQGSEPDPWDIEITNGDHASGGVSLASSSGDQIDARPIRYDNLTVGPMSDPEPPGELESVDGNLTQVIMAAASDPRQTFDSFGWSQPSNVGTINRFADNADALFEDVNMKCLRIWVNPENPQPTIDEFVGTGLIQLCLDRGVDRFLMAPEAYTEGDPTGYAATLADAVKAWVDGGIPVTHTGTQNEPGSGGRADIPLGELTTLYQALRTNLDNHGLQAVEVIAPEYASFDAKPDAAFDRFQSDGSLGLVYAGAGHSYNMASRPAIWDQRWMTDSVTRGLWMTEAGNAGIPHICARFLNDLNFGVETWIFFIGINSSPTNDDPNQKLLQLDGTKNAYYDPIALISNAVIRGTRPRLCSVSSPTTHGYGQMVYTFDLEHKPKVNASVGLRPDGKWYVAIQNNTILDAVEAPGFGLAEAEDLQVTLTVDELVGQNKSFSGSRASNTGALTSVSYPMVDGQLRITLLERELVVLVEV